MRADQKVVQIKDDQAKSEDSDSADDMIEVMKMKKINKKFSKLMSFDIEKEFAATTTQNINFKHQ